LAVNQHDEFATERRIIPFFCELWFFFLTGFQIRYL